MREWRFGRPWPTTGHACSLLAPALSPWSSAACSKPSRCQTCLPIRALASPHCHLVCVRVAVRRHLVPQLTNRVIIFDLAVQHLTGCMQSNCQLQGCCQLCCDNQWHSVTHDLIILHAAGCCIFFVCRYFPHSPCLYGVCQAYNTQPNLLCTQHYAHSTVQLGCMPADWALTQNGVCRALTCSTAVAGRTCKSRWTMCRPTSLHMAVGCNAKSLTWAVPSRPLPVRLIPMPLSPVCLPWSLTLTQSLSCNPLPMRLNWDSNTLHMLKVWDIRLALPFCTTDMPVTACVLLFLSSCNDTHNDTSIIPFFIIYTHTAPAAMIQAFVRHCIDCNVYQVSSISSGLVCGSYRGLHAAHASLEP